MPGCNDVVIGSFDPFFYIRCFGTVCVGVGFIPFRIPSFFLGKPHKRAYHSINFTAYLRYEHGFYLDDNRTNQSKRYIAESDDPTLTSISGYTHLGVYNGHSYFSRDTSTNWATQAQHATANSVYMLIIDSVDEWEAVRDMLYEKNLDVGHWIGLTQKRNQTLSNGWFWIGKDNLPGSANEYDPANHDNTVVASTETVDNFAFYFEDQFELVTTNDGILNPGESANYTASYVIQEDAVTDGGGFIENTVLAKANSSANQGTTTYDVQDTSDGDTADVDGDDDGDFENDPTVISLPRIKVTKTSVVNDDNEQSGTNAGDTIDYTITVENIGGDTLSNISFEDTFVDADGNVLVYDSSNTSPKTGAVFDHENTSYDYITLGSQQWMTSNYGPTTYTDGTVIPEVTDSAEWANLTTGAWRWADSSDQTRGKLYNYYAIEGIHDNDPNSPNKQFIPNGWRLPTYDDFNTTLHNYLNYYGHRTNTVSYAQAVGSENYWQSVSSCSGGCPGYSANNNTGIGIIPNGHIQNNGNINYLNQRSYLWTSEVSNDLVTSVYYTYNQSGISKFDH